MKYFATILSIYIIFLACQTCVDGDVDANTNGKLAYRTLNESHEKDHTDACSPFCVCNCCQGIGFFEVKQLVSHEILASALIKKQLPQYTSTLFSSFQNSIWQPPKIS